MNTVPYVHRLHHTDTLPVIDLDNDMYGLFPDATDTASTGDPDHAQCPGCQHWWPLTDLSPDRNGDNICPDCVSTWSAYPDHR